MNSKVADILELSVAEKIQIVEDIWDSISEAPEELPVSEKEKAELDKRLENYLTNPDEGIKWDTLKNDLLQKKET